jgi:hypothetical protein
MARERKPLGISCDDTDCAAGLHCFRVTTKLLRNGKAPGTCIECGANLVDWNRVRQRDLSDVANTFKSLKYEFVRHYFWHKHLSQKAINHARRKGKRGLRQRIRHHLENVIGPQHPFHDGFQTTMADDAPTTFPYAQHATATCCRKCLEYWHGIPIGRELISSELDYLSDLVLLYIQDRIPNLTEEGEHIPPLRKKAGR